MPLRIAYIHARLGLNDAPLRFMPFGLSAVQSLTQAGHHVELFLAESPNTAYYTHAAKVHFLSARWLWERPGKVNYWLLNSYFEWWHRSRRSRYDVIISSGQAGCAISARLARRLGVPLVCFNDEFPNVYHVPIWRRAEQIALAQADLVVVPDECRFEPLCQQTQGLESKAWVALPNAPLQSELEKLPDIDWNQRLQLPLESRLFLQAGGLYDFNQIAESMVSVAEWPEQARLLINGKETIHNPFSAYDHLWIPQKMLFSNQLLNDPEFHSLLKFSAGSFGLYRNLADLHLVGKSSGKIMRSLACGRPVIASRLPSLQFIETLGIGQLVSHPREIPQAIQNILEDHSAYTQRCYQHFSEQLSFEVYWQDFVKALSRLGVRV